MIYKQRATSFFLQATIVWCVFSFKIVLGGVGEGGVRVDDLLILIAALILLTNGSLTRIPISRPFKCYLLFMAISFVSVCWNSLQGRVAFAYSFVFFARLLEYLVFYPIGYWIAKTRFDFQRVLTYYLWCMVVVIPLQMFQILPTPGVFGSVRAVGNTNGPYELAAVAAFILCFSSYSQRSVLSGSASTMIVLLSASRITSIATLLSLARVGVIRFRSKKLVVGGAVLIAVIAGGIFTISSSRFESIGLFDRFSNSKSINSWSEVVSIYDAASVYDKEEDYAQGAFVDLNGTQLNNFEGDASGLMRFTRWITLMKSTLNNWDSLLIGLGPSFGTIAVDGYFVRVFVETGLAGLITFGTFAVFLLADRRTSSWEFREFIMIMLITACFIDIFTSYKPMSLLWMWHGMHQYRLRARRHPSPVAGGPEHHGGDLPPEISSNDLGFSHSHVRGLEAME